MNQDIIENELKLSVVKQESLIEWSEGEINYHGNMIQTYS